MNDTIVIGGFLIVDSHTIHKNWGLVIKGDSIHAIGPNSVLMENYSAINSIDATDKIIMPGFVNGHNHAYGILSHGIPIDRVPAGFKAFLEDFWWPCVENRLDNELITAAVAASCYEMIDSGITSFCDVLEA
ncbi:amidohydrolase family protein, partial [bacterium]|nr:amidohydrolase family protein [bacterium]